MFGRCFEVSCSYIYNDTDECMLEGLRSQLSDTYAVLSSCLETTTLQDEPKTHPFFPCWQKSDIPGLFESMQYEQTCCIAAIHLAKASVVLFWLPLLEMLPPSVPHSGEGDEICAVILQGHASHVLTMLLPHHTSSYSCCECGCSSRNVQHSRTWCQARKAQHISSWHILSPPCGHLGCHGLANLCTGSSAGLHN